MAKTLEKYQKCSYGALEASQPVYELTQVVPSHFLNNALFKFENIQLVLRRMFYKTWVINFY